MTDIASEMRYAKNRVAVLGREIAYVDTGIPRGGNLDPIVFLHGNITQSYMWRNVIPHLESAARCIAIDNIGQGDSDKLPDSGPGSYRLAEHQRYIDATLAALGLDRLDRAVTLVMHDWGVQLGLTWANAHRGAVKGVAYLQGLMGDMRWDYWPPEVAKLMARFRSDEGEALVLEHNVFVEKVLPAMVIRELPQAVWDEYRRPYLAPGEGRRPTLTWPREIPIEGEPADVLATIEANNAWLHASPIPKLFIHCRPGGVLTGHILEEVRRFPNQTEVGVEGLHYVMEDSPHEIGAYLADWYAGLD